MDPSRPTAALDGAILFGGYDKAKFKGDLIAIPMQPDSWFSQVTTINDGCLYTLHFKRPTLGLVQQRSPFDVIDDPESSPGLDKGTLNFGFGGSGGPVISVPLSQLALLGSEGESYAFPQRYTGMSIWPLPLTQDVPTFFGDTFLRSTYVNIVYDLDNKQIAIAPTIANTTESNIVDIGRGDAEPTRKVTNAATQTTTGLTKSLGVLSSPTSQIIAADASATRFRLRPAGRSARMMGTWCNDLGDFGVA
jgi:hypothetical protein